MAACRGNFATPPRGFAAALQLLRSTPAPWLLRMLRAEARCRARAMTRCRSRCSGARASAFPDAAANAGSGTKAPCLCCVRRSGAAVAAPTPPLSSLMPSSAHPHTLERVGTSRLPRSSSSITLLPAWTRARSID